MPLSWSLTIAGSAALFAVAAWFSARARWLSIYLAACVPASIIWLLLHWTLSQWLRPVLLVLQLAAVLEAICLLHRNCWNPTRRYLLAGFLAVCAIAGTFAAVEYPGYPKALWWVQLWVETGSAASCFAALGVWRWFRNFQPAGWTIGNAAIMGTYSGIEVAAMLIGKHLTMTNWLNVDVGVALSQDVCLFWWIALYSRDL